MTTDADIWTPGGEQGPAGPAGPEGPAGPSIELQTTDTWVQWRVEGETTWNNLITVAELTGPQGSTGPAGSRGDTGPRGRSIELSKSATHIQWRVSGNTTWNNLVALSSLQGPEGEGSLIYRGDGAPASELGDDWDYYIDDTDPDYGMSLYGPKSGGDWGLPSPLMGPPGPVSDRVILYGNGAPAGSVGSINDFYIDLDTYDLYGPKTTSGWGTGVSLLSSIHAQYGELEVTGNNTAFSLTAATDSTLNTDTDYTQITGIFDAIPHGYNNGVVQGTNSLTLGKGGVYKLNFWAAVSSDSNNTRVAIAYALNGTVITDRRPVTAITTANDVRTVAAHGMFEAAKDDVLTFWIVSDTTADITLSNGVVSINELVGAGTVEGTVSTLDDLSDVDTATVIPTDGDVLVFDTASGTWVPAELVLTTTLASLTDVDLTTTAPVDGDILVYNATSEGWEPEANTSGSSGAETFLELTDAPASYLGESDKLVAVKTDESGLEFIGPLADSVYARVEQSSGQSLSGGTLTIIDFQNVVEDAEGLYDGASNSFIIPAALGGEVVALNFQHQATTDSTGAVEARIEISTNGGSTWERLAQSPNGGVDHFGIVVCTAITKVAEGDRLRCVIFSSVSKTTQGGSRVSFTLSSFGRVSPQNSPTAAVTLQTGTSYTLSTSDANSIVEMDNASSNTLSIPTNAVEAIATGSVISVTQIGAGTTTITASAGVTLNGVSAGSANITGQWGGVSLYKRATDAWVIQGAHSGVV